MPGGFSERLRGGSKHTICNWSERRRFVVIRSTVVIFYYYFQMTIYYSINQSTTAEPGEGKETRKMWVGEGGKYVTLPAGRAFKVLVKTKIALIWINLILIEAIKEGNAKKKRKKEQSSGRTSLVL